MEGILGGERRRSEISEMYHYGPYHLSRSSSHTTRGSLISHADWSHPLNELGLETNGNVDDDSKDASFETNLADETTLLLGTDIPAVDTNGSAAFPTRTHSGQQDSIHSFLAEIPAILVTLLINFMTAIPFGVSYFPLGWSNEAAADAADDEDDGIEGPFPLPGKEALGIRMFLLASIVGQIILARYSKFSSPAACQLIENVPFYHALAKIVIDEQGYGMEALSTLFFVFGLGSVVTGIFFWGLGKAGMGKAVHYFPSHVLVGFIGGIGVFIALSSVGVLTGDEFSFSAAGIQELVDNWGLLAPSLGFEITLRILQYLLTDRKTGQPKIPLLAPFFFLSIVPLFYIGLLVWGVSIQEATDRGYFFPSMEEDDDSDSPLSPSDGGDSSSGMFDDHLWDVFTIINLHTISWKAVARSLPTILGLSCFSVINVPINIPAFANTCKVDVDMNNELICHGYSNILSGLLGGGIQNVMTYSISVLFWKSGGRSKAAQVALIAGMMLLFVVGDLVIPYIPRCMAGTLLLHIGVDLFMEGCYDPFGEYDKIEYGGILVIAFVMTCFGMTPALIAGVFVAMTTYAIQSMEHLDPIFNITTAATLRSSAWTRPPEALAILDSSSTGRARILVIQLQGNLFFGNVVDMGDAIKKALREERPLIAILDFTLVLSMDTSAAQSVNKLKKVMNQTYGIMTNIFVMGPHRGYFPCEYGLTKAILEEDEPTKETNNPNTSSKNNSNSSRQSQLESRMSQLGSLSALPLARSNSRSTSGAKSLLVPKNQVCVDFDEALIFAEDILITLQNPSSLRAEDDERHAIEEKSDTQGLTLEEETDLATHYLQNLIRPDHPGSSSNRQERSDDARRFLSYFEREEYTKSQVVWRRGDTSDSAKLVLSGKLVASVGQEGRRQRLGKLVKSPVRGGRQQSGGGDSFQEEIPRGVFIGELGLIEGVDRLSKVVCESDRGAILYSLSRESWERLGREDPDLARILDHITIRYLSHRVQHVSNRIYETRCLPI